MRIKGINELSRRLDKLGKADLSTSIRNTSKFVLKEVDKNFATQGATLGRKWKKRVKPRPWSTLNRTGALRRSFRARQGLNKAIIHSTSKIFAYHQLGTKRIPPRIMLAVTKQMRRFGVREVKKELRKY